MISVEICIACDNLADAVSGARAAQQGGANTIELCSNMQQDGLTPDMRHVAAVCRALEQTRVMVMIRPRSGDFVYDTPTLVQMKRQITAAARAGAHGVVFGALNADGTLANVSAELIAHSHQHDLAVTYHRAFDAVPNRVAALDQLIALGVDRVLTSGTPWGSDKSALHGLDTLRQTIAQADGKIEVIIGGGVAPANVATLLRALDLATQGVGLHAYSSVLASAQVSAQTVAALVRAAATKNNASR